MNYGLYTIFLGMRARQNTLEAQANNIANATTPGFKAERLKYSTVEAEKKGTGDKQNLVAGVTTTGSADYTEGSIAQTGRTLDIAIEGDAFLQIQTPRGVRYTRAGHLSLNQTGQLVTKNGDLVAGQNGPITVPEKGQLSIGQDGTLGADNQPFDGLKLVRFNNPTVALMKEGDSLFMMTGAEQPLAAPDSKIVQGALENSNINSISEMVAMINNNREFESLQKSVSLLMNDIGRKISGDLGKI
ncbi:MAG: flagellar basal-body rod protein FlgF [Acidobacteria bacterium]|nr:flagellar basal-body rod protein FlgF [Acidobacteriota bacterium]